MSARDLRPDADLLHCAPEAEASVIGALLTEGAEAYDAVAGQLVPGDFGVMLHSACFAAVDGLVLSGTPVDLVSVLARLQVMGCADGVDLPVLHQLACAHVSLRVLRHHVTLVADAAAARALQKAADDVRGIAGDVALPVAERVSQSLARIEKVQQPRGQAEPQKVESFVTGFLDRLQDLADGKVQPGIPTKLPTLDTMLGGGFKPGKHIIIAARPSVGKSSLAQQLCINVAQQGHAAAILSMEMGCSELTDRAVANLGRVPLDVLGTGKLDNDQYGRVSDAVEAMRGLPLFFDEKPAMSLGDIVAKARALKRKHNLKVLAIDYLQLCSSGRPSDSRHHQIEELSRGLKALAKQLDITIVTLSQLNREVEKRVSGKPVLSDLKESGAIEEDADAVLVLWRHNPAGGGNVIGCGVPKNRQGRTGEVALHFEGAYQRWTESTESLSAPVTGKASGGRYGGGEF